MLILLLTIFSVTAQAQTATATVNGSEKAKAIYSTGAPFADPAVIRAQDGTFYALATHLPFKKNPINIQAARSDNLVNWTPLWDAMPHKPAWAQKGKNVWAPHVSYFNNQYVMYASIQQNNGTYCIGVSASSNPVRYKNAKKLEWACGKSFENSFENIDPFAFQDPKSGKKFLYWGSAGKPLRVRELSADGLEAAPGTETINVLWPVREPRGRVKDSDGYIYGFGTQLGPEGDGVMTVQARKSKDGVKWDFLPDAVPKANRPTWAYGKPDHWAPQVIRYDGQFLMYLTISKSKISHCITVGYSAKAGGPYSGFKEMDCSPKHKLINPIFYEDAFGEAYLYWEDPAPDSRKVVYRKLSSDRQSFAEGTSFTLVSKLHSWMKLTKDGYEDLIEGAWVTYKNEYYYLYYSGDECCSRFAHYAVSVARSRSPTGPFEKMADYRKAAGDSVILKGDEYWSGPGHNSIIEDDAGTEWILYHAIPNEKFYVRIKGGPRKEPNRVMLLGKIKYSSDLWPYVEGIVSPGNPDLLKPMIIKKATK
jgi:arabinan endo-1,5-alpha-L-arabinosidase